MSVIKLQEHRPGSLKQRLANDSFLGDPNYLPPVSAIPAGSPFDYRIERVEKTGMVALRMGSFEPFEVGPMTAAKMAMLLLKAAGPDAAVNVSLMVLKSAGILEIEDGQK